MAVFVKKEEVEKHSDGSLVQSMNNEADTGKHDDLLKRYIKWVISCQGTSFIDSMGGGHEKPFTKEELDKLRKLEMEIENDY